TDAAMAHLTILLHEHAEARLPPGAWEKTSADRAELFWVGGKVHSCRAVRTRQTLAIRVYSSPADRSSVASCGGCGRIYPPSGGYRFMICRCLRRGPPHAAGDPDRPVGLQIPSACHAATPGGHRQSQARGAAQILPLGEGNRTPWRCGELPTETIKGVAQGPR